MEKLSSEQKEYYLKEADGHANFLAEQVFKPAFVMAFVHGVRHGREDAIKELNQLDETHLKNLKKLQLKDKLNREHKLRQRNKKDDNSRA